METYGSPRNSTAPLPNQHLISQDCGATQKRSRTSPFGFALLPADVPQVRGINIHTFQKCSLNTCYEVCKALVSRETKINRVDRTSASLESTA